VVALDDLRSRSVTPFDRIGESVVDARIDLEFVDSASDELPLHRGDERPHEALPAVCGIDKHIEQAGAGVAPGWSRDGEADQRRAIPCRHHDGVAVGGLPPHLARRERARAPFLPLELQHPRTELAPSRGIE